MNQYGLALLNCSGLSRAHAPTASQHQFNYLCITFCTGLTVYSSLHAFFLFRRKMQLSTSESLQLSAQTRRHLNGHIYKRNRLGSVFWLCCMSADRAAVSCSLAAGSSRVLFPSTLLGVVVPSSPPWAEIPWQPCPSGQRKTMRPPV